ncbi:hypothetical protein LV89_02856 [Arcicella aurantiaca]|uniref:Uncharacterized protein n=1 Tax=Arcicella aurantiaca TaxID=591202 RepID=A0A316EQA9_9BACT|nr:hypothetical protein [Arcicella aurantiaca]PWK25230.1 hypothetical protein LV89_02856 [Arcicella aurantiaca]
MKNILQKNAIWGIIIFFPVALYFYFLSEYAINIPKWDDHALKAFIVEFQNANGFAAKIQAIFKQHNEHRIAFDRFFTLIVFYLHGTIEYRWLMWIGNFTLLGILFIFFRVFKKTNLPIAYFAPIPLIFFQLQLWENTFWGMAAMQNFGVVFFILGLIYLICSDKKSHFYLAILFAFFATYTSGNGITAFPICIVLLVLQKRFKESIVFGLVSAILIFLYFFHYQMPPSNPPMNGIGIGKIALGFLSFLGSAFDLLPYSSGRVKVTILFGAIFLALSAVISVLLALNSKLINRRRDLSSIELFILGSLMFLIGTGIVVTYTRISFGEVGLLTSRYKIYSVLLTVTLYLAIVSKFNVNRFSWVVFPIVGIAILFNFITNFINFKEVVNFRNQLMSFSYNWALDSSVQPKNNGIKLYETPTFPLDNHLSQLKNRIQFSPVWLEKVTKSVNSNGIFIQNSSFKNNVNNTNSVNIIVQSAARTYLMPTQLSNFPVSGFVRTAKYWQNGFASDLNYNEFDNGKYYLGILIQEGKNIQQYYLNDSLIVNKNINSKVKTNW